MEFGIAMGPDVTAHTCPQVARTADDLGFRHITFMDCGFVAREVHIMTTLALLNSEHLHVGHGVTDPLTYRPSELANIACTLNELSNGRAFIGLGLGSTSSRPATRSATLKEVREAVNFIHAYSAGEEAEWQGNRWQMQWVRRTDMAGTPAQVVLGGYGPKAIALGGEVADTVMLSGVEPEFVNWQKEMIAKGAAKVGRDPGEVKLWARTMVHVSSSKEQARDEIAPWAAIRAMGAWHSLCKRPNEDSAPMLDWLERAHPGLTSEWEQIAEAWEEGEIGAAGGAQDKFVSQRTVDFFALTGSPEEIVADVNRLGDLGITSISSALLSADGAKEALEPVAREVMPHFR